jgi:hypothetical protein
VTASSQTPAEQQPPAPLHDPVPLQVAAASYATALPVPAGHLPTPAPEPSPLRAAEMVIAAAMQHGAVTPHEIAQAEHDAGLLFDPQLAQDLATAAAAQAHAEDRAALADAEHDREALAWLRTRWLAVGRLCEGRQDLDLIAVREILTAADGREPTGAPLAITWDGLVLGPSGDTARENTLVPCTTARGGTAALVLTDTERLQLGHQLLAVGQAQASVCSTPGCGCPSDQVDASDPRAAGWICLEVAGTGDGPRWWCSPACMTAALAAAQAAELADAEQLAAGDPDQQIPYLPATEDKDVARCVRCGCTEEQACEGGCAWVPNRHMVDLCTACATPEELAAARGGAQ